MWGCNTDSEYHFQKLQDYVEHADCELNMKMVAVEGGWFQKGANELGLYDMSGNLHEFCSDNYGLYGSSAQINPIQSNTGYGPTLRGGCWDTDARHCRVSVRSKVNQQHRTDWYGIRVVCLP